MEKQVSIIGSGLVGSLLSIFLARKGFVVNVFEKRNDPRKSVQDAGRSINLALSTRGLTALQMVGLDQKVIAKAIPVYGRMIHQTDGKTNFQPYTINKKPIYAISRSILNQILVENAALYENITFNFNHQLKQIDKENNIVYLQNIEKNQEIKIAFDVLFGADGAFSAVRDYIKTHDTTFSETIDYLDFSYLEFVLPADENNNWILEKNALHIYPRKNFMFMALPNLDGSFTCTLYLPNKGIYSFENLQIEQEILTFFHTFFPDVLTLIPNLVKAFLQKKPSFLTTIHCFPWTLNNNLALIGDAAHAIVPFYGQGMNCGFEDCTILDGLLEQNQNDLKGILHAFEESRKPNADAIAKMALENFIEMRDLVTDAKFLAKKAIENDLKKKLGDEWQTKYEMVTFSNLPYAEVDKKNILQNHTLEDILVNIKNENI